MVKPMRAAVYTRVSLEDAARDGLSLPMQEETCRRVALAAGASSLEVFCDPGASGMSLKRPALQELLRRLPDLDALFVYRMDRLARPLRDRLAVLDACISVGVSVHSTTERVDLDTIMGRAMVQMMGVFAEVEVETLRERVRDALAHRVKTLGLHHGKPPYGYRLTTHGEPMEPHPDQAPVILNLFRRYAAGASLISLARDLNRQRIPCAQGGLLWSANHIHRILHSRTYLGEVKSGGEWVPGKHVALVTSDLYRRCARRLATRATIAPHGGCHTLSPLLRCSLCSGHMTKGQWDHARGNGPRYSCATRHAYGTADRHAPNSVAADKAEAGIWIYVQYLLTSGEFQEGLEKYLVRIAAENASGQLAAQRKRLREVEMQLARALRGYSLGNIPEELYLREVQPLTEEHDRLLRRLERATVPTDAKTTAAYLRRITPETYVTGLRRQPMEIQIAFLGQLFEYIEVNGNALRFLSRYGLSEWTMMLPPRWEKRREVGWFPLPDGSQVSGRSPRREE